MADYIDKNANKSLFILLLIVIVIIAGLVVFYSLNFKAINKDYDQKVSELNKSYNALTQYQGVLNQTKTELQLKTEREQGLSNQFVDVKTQRDSLETERNNLKDDNAVLQGNLNQLRTDYSSLNSTYSALNRTYYAQVAQIESLNTQVSSLRSQLAACTP